MLAVMDRDDLKRLLGPFPTRCALDAVRLGAVDCGSYVRETIEYAVEADERIKCFVLVPKHIDRAVPAILLTISTRANFIWERAKLLVWRAIKIKHTLLNLPREAMLS